MASSYEVWHCEICVPYYGPSEHRRRRAGLRKRRRIDFVKLNDPGVFMESENGRNGVAANDVQDVDFGGILRLRKGRGMFKSGSRCAGGGGCLLKLAKGEEFNATYAAKHGFTRPVLFANTKAFQLGIQLPKSTAGTPFTFASVAELVGQFRTIQVIDTATQLTTEYTLQEWVEYLEIPVKDRTRIYNVITLEFSQTPLGDLVTVPKFARDVDFVNLHWPKALNDVERTDATMDNIEEGLESEEAKLLRLEELKKEQPQVTKYCLMSAAGSYTDFHVDFGGTAVWYHVYTGSKVFYFIEPTAENLRIYSRWATNSSNGSKMTKKYEFLPDLISSAGGKVYEVVIRKGKTLFIPSGWIHAVYTPEDSLVFGGNFVHRHSLEMQLKIYRLEGKMRVGMDFRFPKYQTLMWYVARDFLRECDGMWQKRQSNEKGAGPNDADQRKVRAICASYSQHILRGYNALAKELERWSGSKAKFTIQQYPEGMNVVRLSSQLGELMKRCVACIDEK